MKILRALNVGSVTVSNSFQFLNSSLDSLVKSASKDDFKYLSQEFDNNVLDTGSAKIIISLIIYEQFWKV